MQSLLVAVAAAAVAVVEVVLDLWVLVPCLLVEYPNYDQSVAPAVNVHRLRVTLCYHIRGLVASFFRASIV